MNYPTLEEIKTADRLQLAKWYRFLPIAETSRHTLLVNIIVQRFSEMGGFTPEISKQIGW